jgi:hypothetical protein
MHAPTKAALVWSGGKDSALALYHIRLSRPVVVQKGFSWQEGPSLSRKASFSVKRCCLDLMARATSIS